MSDDIGQVHASETFYQEARGLMAQANDRLTSLAVFVAGLAFTLAELFGVEHLTRAERYLLLAALALNLVSACLGVWVTLRVNEFLNKTGDALLNKSPDATLAADFDPWQYRGQLFSFAIGLIALGVLVTLRLL